MSGDFLTSFRGALLAALRAHPVLHRAVHVMDDGANARPAYPHMQLSDAEAAAWGAKDRPGGELRMTLTLRDKGTSGRIAPLIVAMTGVAAAMPRVIDGWENAGVVQLALRRGWTRGGVEEVQVMLRLRGWRAAMDSGE